MKAQKVVEEDKETERAEEQTEREELAFGLQQMTVSFYDRAMVRYFIWKEQLLHLTSAPCFTSKVAPLCLWTPDWNI